MRTSSCGTYPGFKRLFSRGATTDCPVGFPESSARYDLAVVVSRPVSIFLRVLTGFFLFGFPLFTPTEPHPACLQYNRTT